MNKTRTWKFFSVLMALALVLSLGAAIVPASPAQAVSSKIIGTDLQAMAVPMLTDS